MELIGMRYVRLAPLRAGLLSAMGVAAALSPGFLEQGLAYAAIGYLFLCGVILVLEACVDAEGPRALANRVGLLAACVLFLLAGGTAALMQQSRLRILLYLSLILVGGAADLAAALLVFRSAALGVLAGLVMAGGFLWMLTAPFGGLTGLHWCLGVLLLLSAVFEVAAWAYIRRRRWGGVY